MTIESKAAEATPAETAQASADQPAAATPNASFLLSPATYAPKKGDAQPWHQRNNKSNHDKRPGMAPKGTRRSMGKR